MWDDIREKAEARLANRKATPHFLGAVVLDPQPREGLIGVDVLHIIDGQQRLTTLQFVMASVLLTLRRAGQNEFINIVTACLRNGNPETMRNAAMEVFKVWPTFRDRRSFTLALDAVDLDDLRTRFPAHFTQPKHAECEHGLHAPHADDEANEAAIQQRSVGWGGFCCMMPGVRSNASAGPAHRRSTD
ncbi:MAG: DUF262 domain-containing protein [Luteitalea sp.]|nr:DUF262 domain-containing protein [Luteitalea sp.]